MRLEKFDTSKSYNLKRFDCNNEMINTFVKKSLKKRVKRGLSQAYILLDGDRVAGFYTLDSFAITRDSFEGSDKMPAGLPPMVPVVKLGMLGVDKHYQRKGIGKRLLRDAFIKVVEVSDIIGCKGIYLLAESEAIAFYKKLGFIALNDTKPTPMFLSIETIKALMI